MDSKYTEPLKWWDSLPAGTRNDLLFKYRKSGLPEFDHATVVFNQLNDWDRIVIIYEKEYQPVNTPISELLTALGGLLNNNDSWGCPMCDCGVLRNPEKEHWDNCVWNNARKVYDKYYIDIKAAENEKI